MEGYLTKKSRGEKTFGSKKWSKRWFVVKHQTVTYYESFDMATGLPVNEKGSISCEGCEIFPLSNSSKQFIFAMKNIKSQQTLLCVQAEDARMMNSES
jgi:hypothetical protein